MVTKLRDRQAAEIEAGEITTWSYRMPSQPKLAEPPMLIIVNAETAVSEESVGPIVAYGICRWQRTTNNK